MSVEPPPVVVVGAGAAGLMAALFAARAGAPVVLVEGTKDGGRKILISGGGRCNILPSVATPRRYVTDSSPNTLRNLLMRWPLREQRAFFERELAMPLEVEPETGKLFPSSHKARDVRDGLVRRVHEAGARTWFGTRVVDVISVHEDDGPAGVTPRRTGPTADAQGAGGSQAGPLARRALRRPGPSTRQRSSSRREDCPFPPQAATGSGSISHGASG
jgi:flavin-dependent dehydrogenase